MLRIRNTIGKIGLIVFTLYISIAGTDYANARILFQDDTVAEIYSDSLSIGSNDAGAVSTSIKFGSDSTGSENGNIAWNIGSNTFGVDHTLAITGGLSATDQVNFSASTGFRMREVVTHTTAACVTVNELVLNTTTNQIYKCTVVGSPGTWVTTAGGAASVDFEGIYTNDADKTLTTSNAAFTIATGTNDFIVDSNDWNVDASGNLDGNNITANGTLDANGVATIGDNGDTITLDSSDWDISATGTMTGIGAITMDGLLTGTLGATLSGAVINLNAGSNFATNIGTGGSNGAVSIGGNSNTVAIDSSDWDITTTGAMTGIGAITMDGLLTGTLGATLSGATINLNAGSNFATNIGTGGSNGAVSIGGGSNTVAVNSTSWDVSTAGVGSGFTGFTSTGTVDFSGATRLAMQSAAANPGTCTEGDLFYNSTTNFTYVCTAANTWNSIQPDTATFTDTTPAALADNDTTEIFNDATRPNITTDSTSSTVMVAIMVRGTVGDGDGQTSAFRVIRETDGTNPSCAADPQVGRVITAYISDAGMFYFTSATFLDTPGVAGQIRYTVCSSAVTVTSVDLDTTVTEVNIVLTELEG